MPNIRVPFKIDGGVKIKPLDTPIIIGTGSTSEIQLDEDVNNAILLIVLPNSNFINGINGMTGSIFKHLDNSGFKVGISAHGQRGGLAFTYVYNGTVSIHFDSDASDYGGSSSYTILDQKIEHLSSINIHIGASNPTTVYKLADLE